MMNDTAILQSLIDFFLNTYEPEIKKLRTYIENMEKIDDVPQFRLPNWPKDMNDLNIDLGKRTIEFPELNSTLRTEPSIKNMIVLSQKKVEALTFRISPSGVVRVALWNHKKYPFHDELEESYGAYSNAFDALERLRCFVVFHQFLKEIYNEIIKLLNQDTKNLKDKIKNSQALVEAVKRSFEPLIPFIVADKMAK